MQFDLGVAEGGATFMRIDTRSVDVQDLRTAYRLVGGRLMTNDVRRWVWCRKWRRWQMTSCRQNHTKCTRGGAVSTGV